MKKVILGLLLIAQPGFATVQVVKNCQAVEAEQSKKDFVSSSKYEILQFLSGNALQVAISQVEVAKSVIKGLKIALDSDYTYKLSFLGKTYDALNVDLGGNGQTLVFVEGTDQLVNMGFFDGDLYVEGKRCHKVVLPGDTQF